MITALSSSAAAAYILSAPTYTQPPAVASEESAESPSQRAQEASHGSESALNTLA